VDNTLVCIDAQTQQLYDTGYLHSLPPADERAHTLAPPNYARYVNSIHPSQSSSDLTYNTIFLPDPMKGFSWLVSGAMTIAEDTVLLVDYGPSYWESLNPPTPQAFPDVDSPLVTTGKAFSSDSSGDGP
jgi:hypothetical protein